MRPITAAQSHRPNHPSSNHVRAPFEPLLPTHCSVHQLKLDQSVVVLSRDRPERDAKCQSECRAAVVVLFCKPRKPSLPVSGCVGVCTVVCSLPWNNNRLCSHVDMLPTAMADGSNAYASCPCACVKHMLPAMNMSLTTYHLADPGLACAPAKSELSCVHWQDPVVPLTLCICLTSQPHPLHLAGLVVECAWYSWQQ